MRPTRPLATLARAALATAALLLAAAVPATLAAPAASPPAAACSFRLGFADLAGLIPDIVGDCTGDELHVANGDAVQPTSGGLLVWRKADNWTAFTDGATTWINGPNGLESRPNDQRFPWETAPVTPSGPIRVGETWPAVGLSLTLTRVDFGTTGSKQTVTLVYALENTGQDTQLLTYDQGRDIYLTDNTGRRYASLCCASQALVNEALQPGERVVEIAQYEADPAQPGVTSLEVRFGRIGAILDAKYTVPLSGL